MALASDRTAERPDPDPPAEKALSSAGTEPLPEARLQERFERFEEMLGYTFHDVALLRQALTHSSVKDASHPSNETLEFLGDSVLGMVIADYVYRELPGANEGDLTRVKSVVVSRSALAKLAQKLGIHDHLAVGKGIRKRRALPPSIAANAVEALIAALYLDGGLERATVFVLQHFIPLIRTVTKNRHAKNYKSLLQQLVQRQLAITPEYPLLETTGPDHLKTFEVAARVGNRVFPSARGRTKKAAEQRAARLALRILREEHGNDA
ncbi:MAG: ribonuclease III [Planctomycetota bacterium]